ncbi:MAG: hypothetical protein Q9214_002329 [Letrouitia sp. 1 TL-2023]
MADALSVIAAVIGIATVAVKSSKALSKLIDNVKGAPEEIKTINQDLQAFCSVVSSFKTVLKEKDIQNAVNEDTALVEMIASLLHPLRNCEEALQNLMSKMRSWLGSNNSSVIRATALDLKWGLSVKGEVKVLRSRLEATKSTLNTALDAITLYVLSLRLIQSSALREL